MPCFLGAGLPARMLRLATCRPSTADTPFVKKGEGFDEMFEEDDSDVEEEKKQAKKNKRKQKGVNFDAAAEGADGTKKGPAPGVHA